MLGFYHNLPRQAERRAKSPVTKASWQARGLSAKGRVVLHARNG